MPRKSTRTYPLSCSSTRCISASRSTTVRKFHALLTKSDSLCQSLCAVAQFTDPGLRRFNLVTMDSRCHGNSEGSVPENWGRNGAAEDVYEFMVSILVFCIPSPEYVILIRLQKAIRLPPVHICGL